MVRVLVVMAVWRAALLLGDTTGPVVGHAVVAVELIRDLSGAGASQRGQLLGHKGLDLADEGRALLCGVDGCDRVEHLDVHDGEVVALLAEGDDLY